MTKSIKMNDEDNAVLNYGFCPLAIFQNAAREFARLACIGNECAWFHNREGKKGLCSIYLIAKHLSPSSKKS